MFASVRREIPDFLVEQLVYCDNLVRRHERSCLLLTRQLKFFEFRRKQLQSCIDLSGTCLAKVSERLREYSGFKGKWHEACQSDKGLAGSRLEPPSASAVSFGKFVYSNIEVSRTYILLHCWDKLVVLRRLDDDANVSYKVEAEFEQVSSFKLINSRIKYQAVLKVLFTNGASVCTDFQDEHTEVEGGTLAVNNLGSEKAQRSEFRQLLERVRTTQTELQVQKALTQREYQRLCNEQTYGIPYQRSLKLEEKHVLSRCGDIWWRCTTDGWLVLGVPLVNNCSPPNLTTPQKIRPLIGVTGSSQSSIHYQHCLYQLQQRFEHLESLESQLDSSAAWSLQQTSETWCAVDEQQLLPECSAVLLIKLRLNELISLDKCPLVLIYEVARDAEIRPDLTPAQTRMHAQQLWLKQLDFPTMLEQRANYTVSFAPKTLHQDLLAIAYACVELAMRLHFVSQQDLHTFRRLLASKYEFSTQNSMATAGSQEGVTEAMDTDQPLEEQLSASPKRMAQTLFYNAQPTSLWYGCLLMEMRDNGADKARWQLYAPSMERACLFLKMLFSELLLSGCNVAHIECPAGLQRRQLPELENALRQELQALVALQNNKSANTKASQAQNEAVLKLELRTDLLANGDTS